MIINVRLQQQVVEDDMVSARKVDRSLGTEDFNRFALIEFCFLHDYRSCFNEFCITVL
jgi:hypothetical protein